MAYLNLNLLLDTLTPIGPVVSVSVPDPNNKATWVIQYDPANPPTQAQRDAVAAAIAAFNPAELQPRWLPPRLAAFVADSGRADLLQRLKTASVSDIDTWLTNNVTNLAQARAVLAAIIKLLVLMLPPE